MQQSQTLPFYFAPPYNQDGGGPGATGAWIQPDAAKTNQYTSQHWENNGAFHVTGANQYGAAQVPGGGGQNRGQVPQQAPTPQQPPPTPNTPPSLHGDMSKPQIYRTINNPAFQAFPRGQMSQQTLRSHNHRQQMTNMATYVPNIVPQGPGPAPVLQYQTAAVMYQGPRQSPPYSAQGQIYAVPQQYGYSHAAGPPTFFPLISAPFPGIPSGGPSAQPTGQNIIRPNTMVPTPSMAPPPPKSEPKKRPFAIKIINPDSMEEIQVDENSRNNNNITPTRSNDSSARETPQPNSGITPDNNVAADFAAMVAAVAGDPKTPAQPPPEEPRPPEPIVSDSEHKQPSVIPSDKPYTSTLSMASEEFVPRAMKQQSEPVAEEAQLVPTVSAETNSPAIELRSKDFSKSTPPVQSPARSNSKKKNEPAVVPPPQPEKKIMRSSVPKEELPKEKREKTRSVSKEQSPAPVPLAAEVTSSQPELPPTRWRAGGLPEEVKSNSLPVSAPEEPASKASQQNGETAIAEPTQVAVDGSKAARQKPKSNKKMRDQNLNRKGVDKEGSDMDAFTDASIVSDEKERPATPASPPPAPQVNQDKIKDDLEEKEDVQEKLVAAKNEENTKVSALNIEDAEKKEEKKPAQLTLKREYSRDQWSPLNPEGKKKYDRDFLMTLKVEPQSMVKPNNLPDVVAVVKDANLMRNNQSMGNFMGNRGSDFRVLMPEYARNSQSQKGPLLKGGRGSQQGNKKNPRVIHMSLSLHEDVKLKTAENAWKPQRLEADAGKDEEQKDTEKLLKDVRGILNKLTPQKFETLMKKFMDLPINSEERLKGVIQLIFDKAVDEPNFSKAYANMCKQCSKIEVSNGQEKVNFRKLLITRCQIEFESNKSSELDSAKCFQDMKNCTDPERKKELQLAYEEMERTIRRKSVGNIRFIGELFKLHMLTSAIMYRCIEHLLSTTDEESLECLCKLLTTIGKDLENSPPIANQQKTPSEQLDQYFAKMNQLAQKRDNSKVSSRVRFMLQDVIELRAKKWIPRREDNNPKTIEQINKEAERESMEMNMALQNHPPPRMNRQDDRKGRGNRGNNQSEDGWTSVANSSRYNKTPAFEAAKMHNLVKNEVGGETLTFGGRAQFIFPTSKTIEPKSGPVFTSNNVFSALQHEKKPPQPSMKGRIGLSSTPSIEREKERRRMMEGVEGEGRNSRGSSMQRERPNPLSSQPPSRESSIPRQPDNKDTERRDKQDNKIDEDKRQAMEEKLLRQTQTIFDEFLGDLSSVEDIKQDLETIFKPENFGIFIAKGLEMSLDKKAGPQKKIGELFANLIDYVLPAEIFVEQLSMIYESIDDISIDIPKVWDSQAQVIVPILASETLNFSHIKAACSPVLNTKPAVKLLVPILTLLAAEKKPGFVRKVWDSSNVSLKDFLPADVNVDAFIKDNSLEYLTGEPPQYEPSASDQLSMDEVHEKMVRMMQSNTPCDKIFQFISSNVGDKVESLQFIRALMTAVCTACMGPNYSIDQAKIKEYKKLIQRYVDNKEDRELACLSAVHLLTLSLDHPKGLLLNIFNFLLEDNLISSESFLKWRDDDSEKLEQKGVSVLSIASFFKSLVDAESEDENS